MARPVTLFTGQFADLPIATLAAKAAQWGYDGLELACWGDHLDVAQGASDPDYCQKKLDLLAQHGLKVYAIGNHLPGQLVCDPNNDVRSDAFAPAHCAGDADKKRTWAVQAMKDTARTAKNLGIDCVTGFVGSSIWHMLYSFPPVPEELIEEGFAYFAEMWNPILDVYDECGVKFGLEVHPSEIAFDTITAQRALEVLNHREAFGFNFDPSHLLWQMCDPVRFLKEFPDRIYHVHMKDSILQLDGRTGILASHLNFGHPDRGWDFRSLGRGGVNFEEIIRTLNDIGYTGPLSVEWEDNRMDREFGVAEACEFTRKVDFERSAIAFDGKFEN